MGKQSAPAAPNPYKTADAQSAANIKAIQESAKISAVDQYAPWGSTSYQRDPKTGVPLSQTINLGAGEQQNYDTTTALRNALASRGQMLAGQLPTTAYQAPDASSGDAVAKALYERKKALFEPDLARAYNESRVTLGERGIPIGSEIYTNENNRLDQTRANAYEAAAQDATLAAGQEQSRLQADQLAARGTNWNEIAAALSGASGGQLPAFQQTPAYQVQAPDIQGLVQRNYEQQMANYNNNRSSLLGGLFGLGTAAIQAPAGGLFSGLLGLSDRRAKTDIEKVGQLDNGLDVFKYRYKDGGPAHIGLMAQDVAEVRPEAVGKMPNGLFGVDYEKAVA